MLRELTYHHVSTREEDINDEVCFPKLAEEKTRLGRKVRSVVVASSEV